MKVAVNNCGIRKVNGNPKEIEWQNIVGKGKIREKKINIKETPRRKK